MKNNNKRSELIQHYFDTKEYRLCPYGLKKHIRRSNLTSGAKECFHLLLDESVFSEDWSTQISREKIAEEIKKHPNTITKLLSELEKSGYIIREQLPSQASIVYINFPPPVIKDLELSNDRTKKIKQCGTIIKSQKSSTKRNSLQDVNKFKPHQKRVGDLLKNDYDSLYNNNIYNNNTDLNLASEVKQTISMPQDQLSVVVSNDIVVNKPIAHNQPMKTIETYRTGEETAIVNSSNKGINLFIDDNVKSSQGLKQKSSEIKVIKQYIKAWQQELDGINATTYTDMKRIGKLAMWIQQYQEKLEVLNKPLKQESLQLSNGERRLSNNDYNRLKKTVVKDVKHNEITAIDANKTLKSMIHSILHGYYYRENVEVAKSVNSVIKKFKNGEWNNSDIDPKDRVGRPQPRFWRLKKCNDISLL